MGKMMEDPTFIKRLQKLLDAKNFDEFFDLVQQSLAEDVEYSVNEILSDPKTTPMKVEQLNSMIDRFAEREEYEKCASLQHIYEQVKTRQNKKP